MLCPCSSSIPFSQCCQPHISGERPATTPEQLMRSRYSAYATVEVDYLIATTHPSTRKHYSRSAIREWAEENTWVKLEILATTPTTVTFKAWYINPDGHSADPRRTFDLQTGKRPLVLFKRRMTTVKTQDLASPTPTKQNKTKPL